MSKYEIANIIISFLALLISIASIIWTIRLWKRENELTEKQSKLSEKQNKLSKKQNELFEEQNAIAMGNFEISIRKQISATRRKMDEIAREMSSIETEEERQAIKRRLNSAIEDNLNAYEEACSKYLDEKIDKERFKKNYYTEIRQLVENEELKEKYFNSVTSKYRCILKVYKEWFNLE